MKETTFNKEDFKKELVRQLRASDQFGSWSKIKDEELLTKKYVKTKEDLKKISVIANIDEIWINEIKMIFKAIALQFERKTGIVCNVVMEMSYEGFGRCIVIADKIVLVDKYFRDAHRFSYRTLEELYKDGEKLLNKAYKTYLQYKPCKE